MSEIGTIAAPTVLVDRRTYIALEDAIRQYHICYHDSQTADAGMQNLVIWGGPIQQSPIIVIAGES